MHKSILAMLVKHAPANVLSLHHMHRYTTMITLRSRACSQAVLSRLQPTPSTPLRHLHRSATRLHVLHTGSSTEGGVDTSKGALLRSVRQRVW